MSTTREYEVNEAVLVTQIVLESLRNKFYSYYPPELEKEICNLIDPLKIFCDKLSTNIDLFGKTQEDVTGLLIDRIDGKYKINNPRVEENFVERWNDSDNDKKQAFF